MSDFKPRPGTFLPYLEFEKQHAKPAKASPLTLLEILAQRNGQSLPLFDLQTQSRMDPSHYSEALKSLRDAGFVVFGGEGLQGSIRLTPSGAQVVRIAEPA
jgi:DNA-binding MarR family transcriptional regulator